MASSEDIAIIGMSCKAPGDATSPEKLWRLCVEGRNAWSEIPQNRFNHDAFYHPQSEHPGRSHVLGGHFLNEDISLFDASFFGLSAEVASSMDPQFRLQLESTFEALENAGIPLDAAAGSRTAVFAGSFFHDYYDSFMRDPDSLPRYSLTGNGAAMLSNRVSHFFDLRGPSVTVDTGCSTGLTALHLACQSLRTGEADMSIVGGANVLLNPDNFVAMSCLGFLGQTGKSYSFDSRGEGYGRGEGVATIVIKPLSAALRDGDTIRAVIKSTLLNQDGKTATITSPSQEAQENLVRDCYAKAALDPAETVYVEAHGTGTKTGDPIELRALRNAFANKHREVPLHVGSLKANIGHLESASGIVAVIKVALALEKGVIPPSTNFETLNPRLNVPKSEVKIPKTEVPWPVGQRKRASISNFGYGGTNAHVIMEHFVCPPVSQSMMNGQIRVIENSTRLASTTNAKDLEHVGPRVIALSAKDSDAVMAMATLLAEHLESLPVRSRTYFNDLAFTLAEKRSKFQWTSTFMGSTAGEIIKNLRDPAKKPQLARKAPRLGFVFNGQGAQWYAMGRELITGYPVFLRSLKRAQRALRAFGADWDLVAELLRDESTSRVNEAAMSMAMSTSIQLALIDLLTSWNITPTAVTSHSSGEAASAYAAGALDFESALAVSYFRGLLTAKFQANLQLKGGMLAVGLSKEVVKPYLQNTQGGRVLVACINSPMSVTLSGDLAAILDVEERLNQDKVFARRLRVPAAYHSHHMKPQAPEYLEYLKATLSAPGDSFGGVRYVSPVTGAPILCPEQLSPNNWVKNMTMPVQFDSALERMCIASTVSPEPAVDMIVEVGPHSALAGPIRQILQGLGAVGKEIKYSSCLHRNQPAIKTMQTLACTLTEMGYPVNLSACNRLELETVAPRTLPDLPSYPWKHAVSYWLEPRANKEHRQRQQPIHDLVGSRVLGGNEYNPTWKQMISPRAAPWLRDHVVQSEILYPAAGYVSMALEAYRQLQDSKPASGVLYTFRDLVFKKGLTIADADAEQEVQLCYRRRDESNLDAADWWDFEVVSVDDRGTWAQLCTGSITSVAQHMQESTALDWNAQPGAYRAMDTDKFYATLRERGIDYGPLFQNLGDISIGATASRCQMKIADTAAKMPGGYQRPHIIHPTTLDSVLQLSFAAQLGNDPHSSTTMVPTAISSLTIKSDLSAAPGNTLAALAVQETSHQQSFSSSLAVFDAADDVLPAVEIRHLHCQAVGSNLQSPPNNTHHMGLCMSVHWEVDFTSMSSVVLEKALQSSPSGEELISIADAERASFHLLHDALGELSCDNSSEFEWYHRIMLDWMKHQVKLAGQNKLAANSARWLKTSQGVKEQLYERVVKASVTGEMVCRIGRNLVDIFRKKVTPLELMLEGGLLHRYYEQALRMENTYGMIRRLMTMYKHKYPRANILEIGGGTAGCTLPVLEALTTADSSGDTHSFLHYTFTDISSGFFDKARQKLASWGTRISYKRLDIEQSVEEQGFEAGSYDLVVACCVLHATKNMVHTMSNVRRLLKPGGKLIMIETTLDCLDMQIIFGTLPGWWLSEEAERKHSPNLPTEMWQSTLTQSGFSGLDLAVKDSQIVEDHTLSLLMSTALAEPEAPTASPVVVKASSLIASGFEGVVEAIKTELGSPTLPLVSMEDAAEQASGRVCILIDDFSNPLSYINDAAAFGSFRKLVAAAKGIVCVTAGGAMEASDPRASMIQGLLRVLRLENGSKQFINIDLERDSSEPPASIGRAVNWILDQVFHSSTADGPVDSEFAIRGSDVFIPRLLQNSEESQKVSNVYAPVQPQVQMWSDDRRTTRLVARTPGSLDSLCFEQVSIPAKLSAGVVEIEPHAFGLNFRDVMVALGQLQSSTMGFECSGIVTAAGDDCGSLRVGDRVCALINGHWSNKVRAPAACVIHIPDDLSFDVAASLPVVFVTAVYALLDCGRLRAGESVLIHAAAGGVGQAAIMVAQLAKADIYVTVGSPEKRALISETYGIPDSRIFSSRDASFASGVMKATGGRGVDVILNSLGGSLLQESWRCIAELGRFVEIGKKDAEQSKRLDMRPFVKASSFTAVDVLRLAQSRPETIARCLAMTMKMFTDGEVRPVSPVQTMGVPDLSKAFRMMSQGKHMGKIVITMNPADKIEVLPNRCPLVLRPDATYVLVGGLGGVGRSLARFLANCGAKHIGLFSRSAGTVFTSDAKTLVQELDASGCRAYSVKCDVTDINSLKAGIQNAISAGAPPVRGVLQGAMVLEDSVFESMSHEQWQTAVVPKVQGTINLHETFGAGLDFFVMLSSLIGVSGHVSQANYAAGGTFQDAFARWRTGQGLPAISIDLGYIQSVGYVAENQAVAERMSRMGYRQITEPELSRIIGSALLQPQRDVEQSQLVTGLAPFVPEDVQSSILWRRDARFSNLILQIGSAGEHGSAAATGSSVEVSLNKALSTCTVLAEATMLICQALLGRISTMFAVPEGELDKSRSVNDYGVDSLVAVELRNWIFAKTQAELSIFEVLQSTSLEVLAQSISMRSPILLRLK